MITLLLLVLLNAHLREVCEKPTELELWIQEQQKQNQLQTIIEDQTES